MGRFFYEGGFVMWPILLLGLAGIVLGAMALGTRSRGVALASISLAAFVMLLGAVGMMWGRHQTEQALAMVNPTDAALIRAEGHKEANRPLQLGGGLSAFGLLLGVAGLSLARQR